MFARTERLLLRPGWAEDAPALAQAIADEAIVRNLADRAMALWPGRGRGLPRLAARSRAAVLPDLRADRRRSPAGRRVRARPAAVGRGRARLLDRAAGTGAAALPTEAGHALIEHRPRAQAAAARGLALRRQSGLGPRAREARLQADRAVSAPRYSCARGGEAMTRLFRLALARRRSAGGVISAACGGGGHAARAAIAAPDARNSTAPRRGRLTARA